MCDPSPKKRKKIQEWKAKPIIVRDQRNEMRGLAKKTTLGNSGKQNYSAS